MSIHIGGNVTIESVTYEEATHAVPSSYIEDSIGATLERLELPKGIIEALTGIRERKFFDQDVMPSDIATRAAQKAIDAAGIDPKEIGCLISTSVCKDYIEPSVSSMVHGNLGLPPECVNFDIGNACLGFVNAINNITMMIEKGLIKYGLIVDGENSHEVVESTIKMLQGPDITMADIQDNFATLTLGSGGAAMVLSHKDISRTGHLINGSVSRAATEHSRLCLGQKDRMKADAPKVMKYGVMLANETWKIASSNLKNWSNETIDRYIPHQVSARNMIELNRILGLTPEKSELNFYTLGNIGPAAVPITLSLAEKGKTIKKGDHVALLGIGSGLNCSMMSVSW
jgi:acyl-CoA:acyl-CoA alkyltransferase